MATGVAPRDEEHLMTRSELEFIEDAMKQKKFRDMLNEYVEEVSDPANRAIYQKEMTQLEKERGYDVTFINPTGGYVIKTSVAGDRKAFINICSNENIAKPSYKMEVVNGQRGMNWQIPYSLIPPREDYNTKKKERCVVYDVVYHPDTLRMAAANKQFRELVNKTAIEGLQNTYNIHFDSNNYRFPKSQYKGGFTHAVLRKEDPNYKPPTDEENEGLTPEIMEKLYPQRNFEHGKETQECKQTEQLQLKKRTKKGKTEFTHATDNGYTIPKYVIKQQKAVDLQDYTYHKDCKQYSAIPSTILIEVNLPMLSSTKECVLDVHDKSFYLISEKPAKYKLNITLPYSVDDNCGNAKFDKSRKMLVVTLPVIKKNVPNETNTSSDKLLKADSGLESEENSVCSEDETPKDKLIEELSSTTEEPKKNFEEVETENNNYYTKPFLDTSLPYSLPHYTHNVLDEIIAFTFHVKNTEPDSVIVKKENNTIFIKFTSVGSGFVPVHYAAIIKFDENVTFDNVTGEAWDNNVILQLEVSGEIPEKFQIGLNIDTMAIEYLDVSQMKKVSKSINEEKISQSGEDDSSASPIVEVTNLGSETNIVVSSNDMELDEDDDIESPTSKEEVHWSEPSSDETETKSILRKPINFTRSYSESSAGEVASSMDYISSDYIPEESSLKKTVRFNDVIARQFYRYNSSIEGQKKKNQRKKSKKRSQDRRKSESEAEDDSTNPLEISQPRKSVLKKRHDSGLPDTSDAEGEFKSSPADVKQNNVNNNSLGSLEKNDVSESDNNDDHMESNIRKDEDNYQTKNTEDPKSIFDIVDHPDNEEDNVFTDNITDNSQEASLETHKNEPNLKEDHLTDNDQESISPFNILGFEENKEKPEPVIWESEENKTEKIHKNRDKAESIPITCKNIKHNTNLYDPDKLNKGQYQEVEFKNDLIFDLDM